MGALERETNRQGGDLSNFQSDDADACAKACLADERCKAMTFVKHPDHPGGICWLKETAAPMERVQGMVSAVKIYR